MKQLGSKTNNNPDNPDNANNADFLNKNLAGWLATAKSWLPLVLVLIVSSGRCTCTNAL